MPILLYRARLGWLLGHQFLLLVHRGRKTGAIRRTVLEVVRYDPARRDSAVLWTCGERADWYRNIAAHTPVEVWTRGRRYVPRYRLLNLDERLAALQVYRRRYRRALRAVMHFLGYPYDGTEAGLRELAAAVLMVEFRPEGTHGDCPADSDASP